MNDHTDMNALPGPNQELPLDFFDAVTVGERGQVVIPQAARERLGITPGSKLLVMGGGGPTGPTLVLFKAEMVSLFLRGIVERLSGVEKLLREGEAPPGGHKP
jgi:AbrB family looped-hinge helix DNA binding protein